MLPNSICELKALCITKPVQRMEHQLPCDWVVIDSQKLHVC